MHRTLSTNKSSDRCDTDQVSKSDNAIGDIFRQYGEAYIRIYQPCHQHIKLIRAMRLCKTPGLGGKNYKCKNCGHEHHVYFGCGHSHCSICQSVKREQWMDKMSKELLAVPYVHLITTMPHQFNSLARQYPRLVYNLMFQVTKQTVNYFSEDAKYLGARTGMISVLHTFGSDMKHHVHIHSLMTYGGINKQGEWKYPVQKKRLCEHKKFRNKFRELFISGLNDLVESGQIILRDYHRRSIAELENKSWSYFVTKPTLSTENIELYLARYINRIAVTNSRVQYLCSTEEVRLVYNDYKSQKVGAVATKNSKTTSPLLFINQYMVHVLPSYFQKIRRYGIHSNATKKKYAHILSEKLKRNGQTIRTVMEIITHILGRPRLSCAKCQHTEFEIRGISANKNYKYSYLQIPKNNSP